MIKRIAFILVALAIMLGIGFVLYQELFVGSDEFKDVSIAYAEGEITNKAKVEAECSITDENRFCYKDIVWADTENAIEFEGYVIVDYTNESDLVTEVSTGTAKLENITEGVLIIRGTNPSDVFIVKDETVAVRYDISFDTKNGEMAEQVRSEGVEFSATLTSELGKTATETFTVEFKN